MLKIYNSLTRQKQEFIPIKENTIKMYVCGVTVYDYCHLGHARTYIAFDMIARYLKFLGYKVILIRNITDVDDKILQRAKHSNTSFANITQQFTKAMHEDFAKLNLLTPDFEPKATDYIKHMQELIKKLITKNYAYIGANGDVFYDISKFQDYGCLSKRNLVEMQQGDRISLDITKAKKNPLDFALWKLAESMEVGWDSPWGYGRPGWHLECSAMAIELLGESFDIHGGGFDLMFPHHENEIAQSEAATNKQFVNYWMHTGFLQINKEKMSKSLGNFTFIKDILNNVKPEVLRYFMLSAHYRSQIDFSYDKIQMAENSLERLYLALRDLPKVENILDSEAYQQKFAAAMNDDFNTPEAIAVLFELAKEINIAKQKSELENAANLGSILKELLNVLGLDKPDRNINLAITEQEIVELITQRNIARENKDWAQADKIRQQLAEKNIYLEDNGTNTKWRFT